MKGGENKGDCRKRNVTYSTFCLPCKKVGKGSRYYGETARTGQERGVEHQRDYNNEQENSHMAKHWVTEHGQDQERPDFGMQIVRSHKSAFSRQVHEAILIEMYEGSLLNSKGEYNRCEIPRLTVQIGQKQWEERKEGPTEQEEEYQVEARMDNKRSSEMQGGEDQPTAKRRRRTVQSQFDQKKRGEKVQKRQREPEPKPKSEIEETPSKKQKREEKSGNAPAQDNLRRSRGVHHQQEEEEPGQGHLLLGDHASRGVGTPTRRSKQAGGSSVKFRRKKTQFFNPISQHKENVQTIIQMFNKIREDPEKFKPNLTCNFSGHLNQNPGSKNLQKTAFSSAQGVHPSAKLFSRTAATTKQAQLPQTYPNKSKADSTLITAQNSPLNQKNPKVKTIMTPINSRITSFFKPKEEKVPTTKPSYKLRQQQE